MPLLKSKSKNAFEKNVSTEIDSGKSPNQALAIAYSVKRKSPKKIAEGGEAIPAYQDLGDEDDSNNLSLVQRIMNKHRQNYAEGGPVYADSDNQEATLKEDYSDLDSDLPEEDAEEDSSQSSLSESLAQRIMRKRKSQR